jgi:hypothetical protein
MKTIQVSGADRTMFHVAARELSNALGAIRIAQASGVSDPWLSGVTTLIVPSLGADTGGLPAPGTTAP